MHKTINGRIYFLRTFSVCIITSFLTWILYQLLMHIKLGLPAESFFMAQVCVVLLIAPCLAAYAVHTNFFSVHFNAYDTPSTIGLLALSPIATGRWLLRQLVMSQVPLLCWVFLSTLFAVLATHITFTQVLQILAVLGVYSLSAGAVGMWGAQVFRDAIFGAEFATLLWCVLIGGAFLINPLKRYVDNLQPFSAPVLHLNPLVVVHGIFDGLDLFRNPMLYELTPVTSYIYTYPKPWYLVAVWQLVIGGCCFFGAWRMCRSGAHIA